jgi:hypothetical protein
MPIEHRVREALETFMERVRHDLDAHARGLTSDLMRLIQEGQDMWRADLDRAVSDARADAERMFRARVESLRGELGREMELRLASERAELQAARVSLKSGVREGRVETLDRLLGAVRRVDEAMSLSGILETLAKAAANETSRVAILLVEGEILKVWGHFGFAANTGPIDMPLADAGVLTATVALRQTSFVPPVLDGRETPAFMRVPAGHTGLIVPIVVGTEAVGLLYADDVDRLAEQEDAPIWTEEVELLVRHASLRLENVTSVRTVEALTQPSSTS